ncbi:MAG TPA: AI-2E family transporter [Thermoanaerobaculia bacterium]|nr:AI-2E family transporter [Thermoanaerobaculia bacterium]
MSGGAFQTSDRTVLRATIYGLVVTGFLLLWFARHLFLIATLGVLFGLVLSAGADWLERRKVPRPLAILMLLATLVGSVWLLGNWLGPTLSEQQESLRQRVPEALERLETWIGSSLGTDPSPGGDEKGDLVDTLQERATNESGKIAGHLFSIFATVAGAVGAVILILVVAIYTAASPDVYRRGILQLTPKAARERMSNFLRDLARLWRRWMVAQLISMSVIGLLTTGVLLLLDVEAAVALGVLAGLAEFIPLFGPLLSAIPAILIAFVDSPEKALWVLLAYIVIQQIESNVITPIVMREGVELPPLVTVIGGALFALFGGFAGLLVAVPILAAMLCAIREFFDPDFLRAPEKTKASAQKS